MQPIQDSRELWKRWHQIKRVLFYNPIQRKFMDPSKYYTLFEAHDLCNLDKIIDFHKNCALYEFIKQYSTEEIKKLITSTMDAITPRGSKQYADILCKC